jgi:glycosyltransferase involved in cell wall biosynthesis
VRLRILTHYYPPEVGAPQTRLSALAHGLSRAGVEVTVHTGFPHYPDGKIKAPYRNRPLTIERNGGVRVMRNCIYPAANRGFARRLANHTSMAAAALAAAPAGGLVDVLLVETPPLLLAGAAVPYARAKRARLVLNVADLWPDSAVEMGTLNSPRAIAAAQRVERAAYRGATAIACATEGIYATLRERPESAGKAALMRPAVDLERFDPDASENDHPQGGSKSAASNGSPLRALYAGTVGLAHGLGTLLDAAERMRNGGGDTAGPEATELQVTIAGDGAGAQALRDRLVAGGPAGVRMLGSVPAERIPSLYAEADVAVVMLRDLPIFEGALPTKMLEAMAAGRPVVLAARGEAARLIEREGCGLVVPPEDPRALAEAFAALAAEPGRRREMGIAGRRAVERDFSREAWLRRWAELLVAA